MPRLFLQNPPLARFEREMMAVPGFGLRRISKTDDEPDLHVEEWVYEDYSFPVGDGCFIGTLVMKKWNRCNGLNCFFSCPDGSKFTLCAWDNIDPDRAYRPACSDINLAMLPLGTTLRTKFVGTRTGKTKWLEAEIVEVPDAY